MAFHNPVTVELFDENDDIIVPVTMPISITNNLQAFDFNYIAVQVETYDSVMREVLSRWTNKELIQYRVRGRWGTETGDVNSIYAYDSGGGEFTFYGRNHKAIMNDVVGFIDPALDSVQRTYSVEKKRYTGSALKVIRDVMNDNLVKRIGVPMTFPSGDMGNKVDVTFRFDEIHQHLYEDTHERGGAMLGENGNIIIDIHRDFEAHKFIMTAREPEHHENILEMKSGLIDRWQITADRGEANRVIVGGPREGVKRVFGSTEGTSGAPETQAVAKAERNRINSNIAALGKTRTTGLATERSASAKRKRTLKSTLSKAYAEAQAEYNKDVKAAKKTYEAALAKAKNKAERESAKRSYDSAVRSAKSSLDSSKKSAHSRYTDDLKEENKTLATNLRTVEMQYSQDVKTQKALLKTLLRQWPYPNRRFPAELYTEDSSPEGVSSDDLNPSDPQKEISTIPAIAEALSKTALAKRLENGPVTDASGELVESDSFYLGEHVRLGDYVMIGIDEDTQIGEQQIEKAIITWTREDGYKVQMNKPDNTETTDEETLKRILAALKDLSTKTGRR